MIIHYSVLSALICTWVAFSKKKVTRFPVLPAESGNHSTCLALLGPPLGESPGAHAEHSAGMERLLPRLEEGASSRQKARREWGWMGTPGKEQAEGSDRTGLGVHRVLPLGGHVPWRSYLSPQSLCVSPADRDSKSGSQGTAAR